MLNLIIKDYLSENTRLVVPNFGAFIKKTETGEIIFTELLKKDDNVLSSLVMQRCDISQAEAVDMVSRYVSSLKQQTLISGTYLIPDFGEIELKDNGVFVFNQLGWQSLQALEIKPLEIIKDIEEISFPENVTQLDDADLSESELAETQKKGRDTVLIIAVIASVIAVLAMIYGLSFSLPEDLDLTPQLHIEQTK